MSVPGLFDGATPTPEAPGAQPAAQPPGLFDGVVGGAQSAASGAVAPALPVPPPVGPIVSAPLPNNQTITSGIPHDKDYIAAVNSFAQKYNVSPDTMYRMAKGEASFDPKAITGSYMGLYQIHHSVLRDLGIDPQAYLNMSRAQQVGVFEKYLGTVGYKPGDGDDQLMLTLPFGARSIRQADPSHVVWTKGSPEWNQNPGWRSPGNGPITVGSALAYYKKQFGGKVAPPTMQPSHQPPAPPAPPAYKGSVLSGAIGHAKNGNPYAPVDPTTDERTDIAPPSTAPQTATAPQTDGTVPGLFDGAVGPPQQPSGPPGLFDGVAPNGAPPNPLGDTGNPQWNPQSNQWEYTTDPNGPVLPQHQAGPGIIAGATAAAQGVNQHPPKPLTNEQILSNPYSAPVLAIKAALGFTLARPQFAVDKNGNPIDAQGFRTNPDGSPLNGVNRDTTSPINGLVPPPAGSIPSSQVQPPSLGITGKPESYYQTPEPIKTSFGTVQGYSPAQKDTAALHDLKARQAMADHLANTPQSLAMHVQEADPSDIGTAIQRMREQQAGIPMDQQTQFNDPYSEKIVGDELKYLNPGYWAAQFTDDIGHMLLGKDAPAGWWTDDPENARGRAFQAGIVTIAMFLPSVGSGIIAGLSKLVPSLAERGGLAAGTGGTLLADGTYSGSTLATAGHTGASIIGMNFGMGMVEQAGTDVSKIPMQLWNSIAFWQNTDENGQPIPIEDKVFRAINLVAMGGGMVLGAHVNAVDAGKIADRLVKKFGPQGLTKEEALQAVDIFQSKLKENRAGPQTIQDFFSPSRLYKAANQYFEGQAKDVGVKAPGELFTDTGTKPPVQTSDISPERVQETPSSGTQPVNITPEQSAATLKLWEARANTWAKENNSTPEEFYRKFSPEVRNSTPDQVGPNSLFQNQEQPAFFSKLQQVIEDKVPNKASADQVRQTLIGAGVKPDEMEHSGLNKYLTDNPQITKQELLDHVTENGTKVNVVVKGRTDDHQIAAWWNDEGGANEETPWDELTSHEQSQARGEYQLSVGDYEEGATKYSQYTLSGGSNYQERLLTLPLSLKDARLRSNQLAAAQEFDDVVARGERPHRYEALMARLRYANDQAPKQYKSSHWDELNVLAHIRHDDRVGPNGEKTLHVAEIQSDWMQSYRKEKTAIDEAVNSGLNGIIERMKRDGILQVDC